MTVSASQGPSGQRSWRDCRRRRHRSGRSSRCLVIFVIAGPACRHQRCRFVIHAALSDGASGVGVNAGVGVWQRRRPLRSRWPAAARDIPIVIIARRQRRRPRPSPRCVVGSAGVHLRKAAAPMSATPTAARPWVHPFPQYPWQQCSPPQRTSAHVTNTTARRSLGFERHQSQTRRWHCGQRCFRRHRPRATPTPTTKATETPAPANVHTLGIGISQDVRTSDTVGARAGVGTTVCSNVIVMHVGAGVDVRADVFVSTDAGDARIVGAGVSATACVGTAGHARAGAGASAGSRSARAAAASTSAPCSRRRHKRCGCQRRCGCLAASATIVVGASAGFVVGASAGARNARDVSALGWVDNNGRTRSVRHPRRCRRPQWYQHQRRNRCRRQRRRLRHRHYCQHQ